MRFRSLYLRVSDSSCCPPQSSLERFGSRAQCEFQRLARNTLHKWANHPAQTRWNGPRERHRLDLDVEAAVEFFIAPIGVEPPEKSVGFVWRQRVLFGRPRVFNLRNPGAARNTVAPWRIGLQT